MNNSTQDPRNSKVRLRLNNPAMKRAIKEMEKIMAEEMRNQGGAMTLKRIHLMNLRTQLMKTQNLKTQVATTAQKMKVAMATHHQKTLAAVKMAGRLRHHQLMCLLFQEVETIATTT